MLPTIDKEDEEDEEGPADEEVMEEEVDMVSAFASENVEEGWRENGSRVDLALWMEISLRKDDATPPM